MNQKQAPPKKKPAQKAKTGMDMNDYITLGSTLLSGGNGAQLLNMLTGRLMDEY